MVQNYFPTSPYAGLLACTDASMAMFLFWFTVSWPPVFGNLSHEFSSFFDISLVMNRFESVLAVEH